MPTSAWSRDRFAGRWAGARRGLHCRIAEATHNPLLAHIGSMLSLALRESIQVSNQAPNTHVLSPPAQGRAHGPEHRDALAARQAVLVLLDMTTADPARPHLDMSGELGAEVDTPAAALAPRSRVVACSPAEPARPWQRCTRRCRTGSAQLGFPCGSRESTSRALQIARIDGDGLEQVAGTTFTPLLWSWCR